MVSGDVTQAPAEEGCSTISPDSSLWLVKSRATEARPDSKHDPEPRNISNAPERCDDLAGMPTTGREAGPITCRNIYIDSGNLGFISIALYNCQINMVQMMTNCRRSGLSSRILAKVRIGCYATVASVVLEILCKTPILKTKAQAHVLQLARTAKGGRRAIL